MESKCHLGVTCLFDSVDKLKWKVDVRTHRIKNVIEDVLEKWQNENWTIPAYEPEIDCVDCGNWNYFEP